MCQTFFFFKFIIRKSTANISQSANGAIAEIQKLHNLNYFKIFFSLMSITLIKPSAPVVRILFSYRRN